MIANKLTSFRTAYTGKGLEGMRKSDSATVRQLGHFLESTGHFDQFMTAIGAYPARWWCKAQRNEALEYTQLAPGFGIVKVGDQSFYAIGQIYAIEGFTAIGPAAVGGAVIRASKQLLQKKFYGNRPKY